MSTAATATARLADILAGVTEAPASYLSAARQLGSHPEREGLRPIRAFVMSTFTFDLVTPYWVVEGAKRGLDMRVTVGPFGQLEQVVLDPTSALHTASPDIVVIAARVEDLAPELVDDFLRVDAAAAIERYVERLAELSRSVRARTSARVLVWNQPPLRRLAAGFADTSLELSQQHAIDRANAHLADRCRGVAGVTVFDAFRLATEVGLAQWFDTKLEVLARCPLGARAQLSIARQLSRMAKALFSPPRKCLVVDLDNTLWGGVVGEDGVGGIALGHDYPGNAFRTFQRALRSYRDRGILLAVASKNNPADVEEVFTSHREMVLRKDDFAAVQIHWQDKAHSLREIANALNIGTDALVFFDDNPVERAWVREQMPEVEVIEVPTEPSKFVDALDSSGAFDQLVITSEDRVRAEQYRTEQQRLELQRSSSSVEEFLRALQMKVSIGRIDATTLPRVAQLLAKTNQFNLTTRRHSEADLEALLARPGTIGLWLRVSDRYGDHGLVAAALAVRDDNAYRVDTFLMSCRVLGRRAENVLMDVLVARAYAEGASTVLAEFIPTKKNAPAANFLATAGFEPVSEPANFWRRPAALCEPNDLYEVSEET